MVETKDIIGWIVLGVLASGGWFFALYRDWVSRQEVRENWERTQRQEKLDKIEEYLNALSELQELYRFFARKQESLLKTEDGQFLVTESGKRIVVGEVLEPEPRFERAIQVLEKTDIKSAIAQKIVQIRLMSGEVFDTATELDPSGELRKSIAKLQWKTTSSIDFFLDQQSFDGLRSALKEATDMRRGLRSSLGNFSL